MKDSKQLLDLLLEAYSNAPEIYQAGRYWKAYESRIISDIEAADLNELRSGKYPIFATFGFTEIVHYNHPDQPFYKKAVLSTLRALNNPRIPSMPYGLYLSDIREMAYRHAEIMGQLAGLKPISELACSTFGNPNDLFEINGNTYTTAFLTYYIRLCFVQMHLDLKGDETIVELGSGSGHQIEIIKKVFPEMTVACFDLPYTLFLCNTYLKNVLPEGSVIDAVEGIKQEDTLQIEKGKVNMFGNWQIPLLKDHSIDLFWNAASFGEMEPEIVSNYLTHILPVTDAVYLLQARHGKESKATKGVRKPTTFDDYCNMLNGFDLITEEDPYQANRKLKEGLAYFHAVWRKKQ